MHFFTELCVHSRFVKSLFWHFPGDKVWHSEKERCVLFGFFPTSLLSSCPNHLILASLASSPKRQTSRCRPPDGLVLIPSSLVKEKLNSLISGAATSSSASCLFLSAAAHYAAAGSAALLSSCTEGIVITADGSAQTTQLHVQFTSPIKINFLDVLEN